MRFLNTEVSVCLPVCLCRHVSSFLSLVFPEVISKTPFYLKRKGLNIHLKRAGNLSSQRGGPLFEVFVSVSVPCDLSLKHQTKFNSTVHCTPTYKTSWNHKTLENKNNISTKKCYWLLVRFEVISESEICLEKASTHPWRSWLRMRQRRDVCTIGRLQLFWRKTWNPNLICWPTNVRPNLYWTRACKIAHKWCCLPVVWIRPFTTALACARPVLMVPERQA